MSNGGYLTWEPQFILDYPWFADRYLVDRMKPLSWVEIQFRTIVGTHNATRIVQRPYLPSKPDLIRSFTFEYSVLWDTESDYDHVASLKALGVSFEACFGLRVRDVFSNCAISDVKYLGRGVATDGSVSGITEITHPTEVYLDGVLDAAAATIVGQQVTALKAGKIEVEYTPLFNVIIDEMPFEISAANALNAVMSMSEVPV